MSDGRIRLDQVAIVLQRPRYPENIGAAARAMKNMGMRRLIVVNPENFDLPRMQKMATHEAVSLIEQIQVFQSLRDALAPFQYVIGTTARLGGERDVVFSPRIMAARLIPISMKNRVALVFGPEDRGLTNEDIRLCHELIHIPTAEFASLNLAQAVMVMCYELYQASLPEAFPRAPRLASRHELDGMYDQLRDVLVQISYINPENPDYWMNKIRRFFTRYQVRAGEVSIIRGICRQIDWYARTCFERGVNQGKFPDSKNDASNMRKL